MPAEMSFGIANLEQSLSARWWYFNIAGLLHAVLLGTVVGPNLEPFFWLLLARPLAAVGVTLLPSTSAGNYRPYLLVSSLLYLGVVQQMEPDSLLFQLGALVLFLLVDVCLDALLAQRCPESEWVGRMGQLTLARAAGLAVGLLLGSTTLQRSDERTLFLSSLLLAMAVLFTSIAETEEQKALLPKRLAGQSRLTELLDSMTALCNKSLAQHQLILFGVSLLAGLCGTLLFPVPVLSSSALAQWLSDPALCAGSLLLISFFALVFERLTRPTLAFVCYSFFFVSLLVWLLAPGSPLASLTVEVAGGLALLVAYRHTLAGAPATLSPALQTATAITIWALGMLAGQNLKEHEYGLPAGLLGLLFLAALATSSYNCRRKWVKTPQPITPYEEHHRRWREPGRHGDRDFNFAAAPLAPKRRPSLWRGLSRVWYSLSVRLPVTLFLAILGATVLAGAWHLGEQKQVLRAKSYGAWTALRSELFLTSLKARIEREMLASNRVPTNWADFIAKEYTLDGRPMKDRDFWGTPLHFENQTKRIRIVSAGPDKELFTKDDLQRFANKPDGVR